MSALAPILQGFFTDRLIRQRQASDHTITAYRNTIRLLLRFAWQQTGRQPAQLTLDDLDAPLIGAFLHHLETGRGNSVTTRNARLAAIHSLFRYAALQAPDHAALIQRVLAIPAKRTDRTIVCYLTRDEMHALLAAPGQSTWHGRRDYALLALAGQTGLRVSELTGVKIRDIHLGRGPHVCCHGKGRKDRITPLTSHTVTTLRAWLTERRGAQDDPLFPSRRGTPLSTDAVERLVAKHAATAAATRASLQAKQVTPHTLRHSAAMALLHSGVDISVIALWLGHESSETSMIYLHADMSLKERALARIAPPATKPVRYTPPDTVLAFLDNL
jgi:site-specific recombinase XerD